MINRRRKLRVGDWVEVKSREEILQTLDGRAQLEGIPFMPQMFQYCGQRFQVYKRAHKTCDTVNSKRSIRISDTIHLDLRCDGKVYGDCQAACLIFWKTAWLRPIGEWEGAAVAEAVMTGRISCTEEGVWAATRKEDEKYTCQATEVPQFGTYLPWWDLRQYWEDVISGNVTLWQVLRGLIYVGYHALVQAGIGLGAPLRWMYDRFQSIWGGIPYPGKSGTIPNGQATPLAILNLKPDELVRVKSQEDILKTLDRNNNNRGLRFDPEMVPFCGQTYTVKACVRKFIDEKTGKLLVV